MLQVYLEMSPLTDIKHGTLITDDPVEDEQDSFLEWMHDDPRPLAAFVSQKAAPPVPIFEGGLFINLELIEVHTMALMSR